MVTNAAPASQPSNESMIYGFLTKQEGLSPAAAAGVLGNFQVESSFSPTAYNPNEGAIGLAQWEGGRRTALQAYAAAHGGKETDLGMQLGYLATELAGPYRNVMALLKRTASPATAAAIWDVGPGGTNSGTGFENSSGAADQQRQNNAQTIYQQITAGQLTAASAASSLGNGAAGFTIPDPFNPLGPLGVPNPLDPTSIPGDIIGGATSGVMKSVTNLVIKGLFTIGGVGLVVLGAYAAAHPPEGAA